MSINAPSQLVDEFKRSGEFDRLRKELLAEFQNGDNVENFTKRIQDIVRQRLEGDQKLQQLAPEAMQRELTQEVDRYPVVERARDEVMSSHTGLSDSIRASAQRLLRGENPRDFSRPSSPIKSPSKHSPNNVQIASPAHTPQPTAVNGVLNHTDIPSTLNRQDQEGSYAQNVMPSSPQRDPKREAEEFSRADTTMEDTNETDEHNPADILGVLPSQDTIEDVQMEDNSHLEESPVFHSTQPVQIRTSVEPNVNSLDPSLSLAVDDGISIDQSSTIPGRSVLEMGEGTEVPDQPIEPDSNGSIIAQESVDIKEESVAQLQEENIEQPMAQPSLSATSPVDPAEPLNKGIEENETHGQPTLATAEQSTPISLLPPIRSPEHAEVLADTGEQAHSEPVPHALIQADE